MDVMIIFMNWRILDVTKTTCRLLIFWSCFLRLLLNFIYMYERFKMTSQTQTNSFHRFNDLVSAYSSSAASGAGVYNSNSYQGQSYSPNYPYVNNYAGYASAGGYPNYVGHPDPYALQAQFQQYFNALSAYNAKYAPFHFHTRFYLLSWKLNKYLTFVNFQKWIPNSLPTCKIFPRISWNSIIDEWEIQLK